MAVPQEVFLSHSSEDRVFVSRLADELRRHGVPVWHSQTNILGAQQWHDEIGAALRRCDWFVVVLSPHSVESMWVKRELLFALQQERFADRIVPILLQPCGFDRLSWVLAGFQFVDVQESFDDGCRTLLRVWGLGYRRVESKRQRKR
jgi:hypothetical protein